MLSPLRSQPLRVVREIEHLLMCVCLMAAESECALVCVCVCRCVHRCAGDPSAFQRLIPVIVAEGDSLNQSFRIIDCNKCLA